VTDSLELEARGVLDLEARRGRREKDRVEEEEEKEELATLEAADEEEAAARRGEESAVRRIETDREEVQAMVEKAGVVGFAGRCGWWERRGRVRGQHFRRKRSEFA